MIFYLMQILSNVMLSYIAYEELTRLVSLPAGIRLIAVVIYRWIGFLGIVLGSVFSSIFSGENLLFES